MVGVQVASESPEVVEDTWAVRAGEDGALARVTSLAVVAQRLLTQKHHLPKRAKTVIIPRQKALGLLQMSQKVRNKTKTYSTSNVEFNLVTVSVHICGNLVICCVQGPAQQLFHEVTEPRTFALQILLKKKKKSFSNPQQRRRASAQMTHIQVQN